MQTLADKDDHSTSLVPAQLASLNEAVANSGRSDATIALCTRLERWLDANPLEVRASVAPGPSASLPPVDWLARLSLLTTPPPALALVEDPSQPEGRLSKSSELAWALVLAAQHIDYECEGGARFGALRRAANALLSLEPTARRALAATTPDILSADRGSRAVREALLAVAFAENLSDAVSALRTIAVAAMAQAFLDELPTEKVAEVLRAEVLRDNRCIAEVVTAYEALCIRRGNGFAESPLHARLVALACDEARLSLIDGRRSSLSIAVDLSDLETDGMVEVVEDLDVRSARSSSNRISFELPPTSDANGASTLAKIPLTHFVATARDRALSATVVLTDPRGGRHAIVFKGGDLEAVHTRGGAASEVIARLAAIAALPDETEIAFFWGRDLLDGRGQRARRGSAEVLLAIARSWDRQRMRAEIEKLGSALVVHAQIDALCPNEDERRLLERWNAASRGGRAIDARLLAGDTALPVAYALVHLGEAHPVGHRCRICKFAR